MANALVEASLGISPEEQEEIEKRSAKSLGWLIKKMSAPTEEEVGMPVLTGYPLETSIPIPFTEAQIPVFGGIGGVDIRKFPGLIKRLIGAVRGGSRVPAIKLGEMIVSGTPGETHLKQFLKLPEPLQDYPNIRTGWLRGKEFVEGGGRSIRDFLSILKGEEGAFKVGEIKEAVRQMTSKKPFVRVHGEKIIKAPTGKIFTRAEGEVKDIISPERLGVLRRALNALTMSKDKLATAKKLEKATGFDKKFLLRLLREERGEVGIVKGPKITLRGSKAPSEIKAAIRVGEGKTAVLFEGTDHMEALKKLPERLQDINYEVGYTMGGKWMTPAQQTRYIKGKAGVEIAPSPKRTPRGYIIKKTEEEARVPGRVVKSKRELKKPEGAVKERGLTARRKKDVEEILAAEEKKRSKVLEKILEERKTKVIRRPGGAKKAAKELEIEGLSKQDKALIEELSGE